MSSMNKRLIKEIRDLYTTQNSKSLLENDYIIHYDDENLQKIQVLIKPPKDSVYRHKFIRLDIDVPDNYPHSPPDVTFVNYDGTRIHPNMYENGKCCATILNTWGESKYEKWTSSMGIETVILTFHSFLDNNPYIYEPGNRDDPEYTVYVKYQSWITCLIKYLQNDEVEIFKEYIHNYLLMNVGDIFNELLELRDIYPFGYYYTKCFEIDNYIINYNTIIDTLQNFYNFMDFTVHDIENINFIEFCNKEYKCNICYDTDDQIQKEFNILIQKHDETKVDNHLFYKLNCPHKFHRKCLIEHIENNNSVCPMCRHDISDYEIQELHCISDLDLYEMKEQVTINKEIILNDPELWIINPLTKRRVKKGGRTYKHLVSNGIIEDD